MFEGSLVESNHLLRTNNRWTTAVSLTVQLAVAGALVAFPLLYPEALPFSVPTISLVAPPTQVPPQPQRMRVATASADSRAYTGPAQAPVISRPGPLSAPTDEPVSMGPFPMGRDGDFIATLGGGDGQPRIVAARTEPAASHVGPLRVSLGVAQGLLLAPIHPSYPPIAIVTKTQGTVVVQAVISKTGTVESLQIVSGPALLRNAALDAIRGARYSPYKLNGQPVEVETTFNVNFRLGDQ